MFRHDLRYMRVPTIRRDDDRSKNGGHGAKGAFAHPTDQGGLVGLLSLYQSGDLLAAVRAGMNAGAQALCFGGPA
jgi:hypothetical protein